MTRRSPVILVLIVAGSLATCRTLQRSQSPLHAELRTDSTQIGVHFGGELYIAKIGFVFVNTTDGPISLGGCGGPPMPQVEKLVNGSWVAAYHPAYLMCRTIPDFSLPKGATFRSQLEFMAAPRGAKMFPQLEVDSIDGVYRLRWTWNEGAGIQSSREVVNPHDTRLVEAISNEFRMTRR